MARKLSGHLETVGRAAGRFLSSFSYVLTTLLVYVVMCFITYGVITLALGANKGAAFITFEIATGGDPYNFKEIAAAHPFLWIWILALHAMSWLIVPVLAATAVDAAYRNWEDRMRVLEMELQDEMVGVLERHANVSKAEADRIAQEWLTETHKRVAIKKKKS